MAFIVIVGEILLKKNGSGTWGGHVTRLKGDRWTGRVSKWKGQHGMS